MAITISTTTINDIDATYPVAGVDNDSQGFRDNFTSIKNSLSAAAADLTSLDANTAKKNEANDFNGNQIQEADFIATTESVYDTGNTVVTNQPISFTSGHYQKIEIAAGYSGTLTLSDWPQGDDKMARMRLEISKAAGADGVITWVTSGGSFKSHADWPGTFTVADGETWIVDFWTSDKGVTVFRQSHGTFS